MTDFEIIPYYKLSPTSLVIFERSSFQFVSEKSIANRKNIEDNTNKYNDISLTSQKHLRQKIEIFNFIAKWKTINGTQFCSRKIDEQVVVTSGKQYERKIRYKLAMVTLTLSAAQHNTDNEIKAKLLNHFLIELRKKYALKNYIWKAEKQENGNIHFHIIIDVFIHHADIRDIWNRIQDKNGFDYVKQFAENQRLKYANGFFLHKNSQLTEAEQLRNYEIGVAENWSNPNSTDVHSLHKVKNIGAYLSKYLVKEVTKTSRTQEIDILRKHLRAETRAIVRLQLLYSYRTTSALFREKYDILYTKISQAITINDNRLTALLAQGVTGRIYYVSQSLSKMKPLIVSDAWYNVPDVENIMTNARYSSKYELPHSTIYSYYFDINNFPLAKVVLEQHLLKSA